MPLLDHESICPRCGLVLTSLHAYHRHWAREHEPRRNGRAFSQASQAYYPNGCPILPADSEASQ